MKRLIVAKSAGFCFGVKRAVDTVYEQAKKEMVEILMKGIKASGKSKNSGN